MQQYYQPLYQQARDLQFRVHDVMSDPNHPLAQGLRTEVQKLTDDLNEQKNPHDIENRIQIIQHSLMQAQNNRENYMNVDHSTAMYHNFENLRLNVRRMPHY
jgi:hypothetical protein